MAVFATGDGESFPRILKKGGLLACNVLHPGGGTQLVLRGRTTKKLILCYAGQ